MMSEKDVSAVVKQIIEEAGASGPEDMGKVMGQAMAKLKGQADGSVVKKVAQQLLSP